MMSNKTPRQKNAAILPPAEILRISNANSLTNVNENNTRDTILSGRYLCFMPSHMNVNEHNPHKMGKPDFIYAWLILARESIPLE